MAQVMLGLGNGYKSVERPLGDGNMLACVSAAGCGALPQPRLFCLDEGPRRALLCTHCANSRNQIRLGVND